ncbi:MAG: UxaA family hydrolase [Oscillospiraceae bacterium]|nr:UxaA family hydrolase [Oscillospiraceae bacterium]
MNAVLIDPKDNVAAVLENIEKGQMVVWKNGSEEISIISLGEIPAFHKIAVRDIKNGTPVIKYGEHIGLASEEIPAGAHVHVHNLASNREKL